MNKTAKLIAASVNQNPDDNPKASEQAKAREGDTS